MLQVKNVTKKFKSGDTTVEAVRNVTLEVPDGTFASIVGASGSGKSTLLALLGALDSPSSGSVIVDNQDIAKLSQAAQAKYRSQKIGFIFQSYQLIPNLTALQNVMLPMEFANVPAAQRRTRAEELLRKVGLTADKQLRKPGRLSGGEQQRVAIARALANAPKLILADEPTGNLDSQTGKMIFDLLHELSRSEKTTIITVTHDLSIAGRTDLVFQLKDGQLTSSRHAKSSARRR